MHEAEGASDQIYTRTTRLIFNSIQFSTDHDLSLHCAIDNQDRGLTLA